MVPLAAMVRVFGFVVGESDLQLAANRESVGGQRNETRCPGNGMTTPTATTTMLFTKTVLLLIDYGC